MSNKTKTAFQQLTESLALLNDTVETAKAQRQQETVENEPETKVSVRKAAWQQGHAPMINKLGRQTDFFFTRAIRAIALKDWSGAHFEKQVFEKAAMAEGADVLGGFLVPEEHSTEVIELITAKTVVRAAGATVMPMARDILTIPRQTGATSAYWIGENSAPTESNPEFGQMSLQAKKLAALVKISNDLISDATPSAEAIVRADIAKQVSLKEDQAFLAGLGSSFEPLGMRNHPDIIEIDLNGTVPDFDDFYDSIYQLENANTSLQRYLMHPRTKNTLRKIKDGNGQYLYNLGSGRDVGTPDNILGYPVSLTTAISISTDGGRSNCTYVIGGDFSEAIIGQRAGLALAASQEAGTAFENDQTWIRAIMREDFQLRTPTAFVRMVEVAA